MAGPGPPLGVIEGFFGRPWGDPARRACAEFLRAQGYCYYIYAPKADRNLRKSWRDPMAAEQLAQLTSLAAHFRACGLSFGVGLTPYLLHLDYSSDAKAALRDKVRQLNQVGVDILCVLFDDMHGAVPQLAALQARVVADVSEWTSARMLMCCPTYYSDDPILSRVFGPSPENYLEDLGSSLDPAVGVFWTGEKVCSASYTDRHLVAVAERLGRRPVIWDNHLANDARERCAHLYLDAFANGWSLNPELVTGLAINPMNQPRLSRIPLAACAQWTGSRSSPASLMRSLCGAELGDLLLSALDLFQQQGLAAIDVPTRSDLIASFAAFAPDLCAMEVMGWLRGDYAFDPLCLTD